MIQSWLTIGGLVFDFSGFALLLREWWLAFFKEGLQIETEEQLDRMRHLRNLRPASPAASDPFAALHKMQDDHQAIRRARIAHKSAMAARRTTFMFAAMLVVVAFCCSWRVLGRSSDALEPCAAAANARWHALKHAGNI
jgi:hypothetical protein